MKFRRFLELAQLPGSVAAALIVFRLASNAAYAERGYEALGGELLVIPFAYAFFFWAFGKAISYARRADHKKRRKNGRKRKA